MDYPEGAKVVNMSIDLKIQDGKGPPLPPCECYCRFSEEPGILLTSIDLKSSKGVSTLRELFNFGDIIDPGNHLEPTSFFQQFIEYLIKWNVCFFKTGRDYSGSDYSCL